MQWTDVFCYALLAITVTASCVKGDDEQQDISDRKVEKRLNKREASILIDNLPLEALYKSKRKVIYRRVSRQKYGHPKPKYGPPRPNKVSAHMKRKPVKKYKGKKVSSNYGVPDYKKRTPKPRYGPPRVHGPKPVYGPPKIRPLNPYHQFDEPAGFGEPPASYGQDLSPPKPTYGEPPVDSYGIPLKSINNEPYPTGGYAESTNNFDYYEPINNFAHEYQSWKNFQHGQAIDNSYAFSKQHPTLSKPNANVFDPPIDYNEDLNINTFSDLYKTNQDKKHNYNYKKKPHYVAHTSRLVNRPWKPPKNSEFDDIKEQVLVGGQYAEPPARYVPKFQPSAPMYTDDEDFSPPNIFTGPEVASSATVSPYVNYKNSNMAFSPQNLNDAFSIVDK